MLENRVEGSLNYPERHLQPGSVVKQKCKSAKYRKNNMFENDNRIFKENFYAVYEKI